jgi:hypothetical protein
MSDGWDKSSSAWISATRLMSETGQSRRFDRALTTSALPRAIF